MAERQFGPYRLVRQIAVGGMAEIHLAKTKGIAGFEKYVALKMIHPNLAEDEQFIEMLVDEAKIAVQLTHANIAQTFDLGRVGDTYYITMEYIDGADLYKILRRASETDIEMPLDVCAFVGKEMLTALDHAHRKRDHSGKALGIVHRDVSPQNVLISYAGEVKLVDFGIAKATSKAKQTAAGVIKGKYYYMSPEQSWGDPIDHRSDIFSAGIVIYEMMTGQMLYLEEDLQKLLEMVRKADIAPPSRLRKGIPPQLERIIMHALAKVPGERYQSAGDFATDLERFLHGYAPAFTASKVAGVIRKVLGDPAISPVDQEDPEIEMRDGGMSTQELDASKLAHASEELERDENSMIFSLAELNASAPSAPAARPATPQPPPKQPTGPIRTAPRQPTAPLPSLKPAAPAPTPPARAAIQPAPIKHVEARPVAKPAPLPRLAKPRMPDEETRELAPKDLATTTAASNEDSGLLGMTVRGPGLAAPRRPQAAIPMSMPDWDASETQPGTNGVDDLDDLDNVGERTMITTPDFMRGSDDDEGDGATMITTRPTDDQEADAEPSTDDDDGPTMQREFVATPSRRLPAKAKAPGPAALAAKIQTPAVSALRTPRPSRRTPPGGVPSQGNVLQAIVQSQPSEAMPTPRPVKTAAPTPPPPVQPPPPQQQMGTYPPPYQQQPYQQPYQDPYQSGQVPPQVAPYQTGPMPQQQMPPQYPSYPGYPPSPQGYPPNPMYPAQLYGSQQQQPYPVSLTGALRLTEGDEIPAAYKIDSGRKRWLGLLFAGIVAISVAAGVTFLIIRGTRDGGPTVATLKIDSTPPGADVSFDGTRLSDRTPLTLENVPVGTRHDIKVELALYKYYATEVSIPKDGTTTTVTALLEKLLGKVAVNSKPAGAEVRINGEVRGRTPGTFMGIDMATAKTIDVRLKDYQPITQDLKWPANGQIDLDLTLQPTR